MYILNMYLYYIVQLFSTGTVQTEYSPSSVELDSGFIKWSLPSVSVADVGFSLHLCLHGLLATDDPCQHAEYVHLTPHSWSCNYNTRFPVLSCQLVQLLYIHVHREKLGLLAGIFTSIKLYITASELSGERWVQLDNLCTYSIFLQVCAYHMCVHFLGLSVKGPQHVAVVVKFGLAFSLMFFLPYFKVCAITTYEVTVHIYVHTESQWVRYMIVYIIVTYTYMYICTQGGVLYTCIFRKCPRCTIEWKKSICIYTQYLFSIKTLKTASHYITH